MGTLQTPAIAISGGYPLVAYTDRSASVLETRLAFYSCDDLACDSGTNATFPVSGGASYMGGLTPSIVMGGDGIPAVTHQSPLNTSEHRWLRCDDATCSAVSGTFETFTGGVGRAHQFVDAVGTLYVSTVDGVTACLDAACDDGVKRLPLAPIDVYGPIVVNPQGNPVVGGEGSFHVCGDPRCETGMAYDISGGGPWDNQSIGITPEGIPVASLRDVTDGDLAFAVGPHTKTTVAFD